MRRGYVGAVWWYAVAWCVCVVFAAQDAICQNSGGPLSSAPVTQFPTLAGRYGSVLEAFHDAPSLGVGYAATTRRLRAGYTGLVLPGACISSYFVYSLEGAVLGGSLPLRFGTGLEGLISGQYLFPASVEADQEITWVHLPPGVRHWTWARSNNWNIQGEVSYALDASSWLIVGVRCEKLITRFGSPIPDYPFTVADMESGLSLNLYQPFIGVKIAQAVGNNRVGLRIAGFPAMIGLLEHFNTCNNAGVPFAHVGSAGISSGYFVQAHGEMTVAMTGGLEVSTFVTWDCYRGACGMNLERRDAGPPLTMTSATVDFSYDRSSLALGIKVAAPLASLF
ncbi:MAG: hypothetical protein ACP5M0_07865 [Desulfomonilaceae bacterium]